MSNFSYNFANGDVKPVGFQNVVSSTGALLSGASCTLWDHITGVQIGSSQAMTVTQTSVGATVLSPDFAWATGQYTLDVQLTFADGVIDNSVTAFIIVAAVPT